MANKTNAYPVVDDSLIDWVIREEGFLNKPTDIGDGKITLGSGLTDSKWLDLYRKKGKWSKEDNRKAVKEELETRRKWAEDTLPNWNKLPINAKRAMLSYKYNYDFTSENSPKLFSAMENSDFVEAVRQMDATSKNPKFKKGLQNRRMREQQWGLQGLFEKPVLDRNYEYPDALEVNNPYPAAFERVIAKPINVTFSPDNYVETRKAEPEEWQRDDAVSTFNTYARIKHLLDSQKWENQTPKQYVPSSGINYVIGSYADGGSLNRKKLWDDLSVSEKAEMMKVAIKNGITTLPEIREKYNEFAEGGHIYDGLMEDSQQMNIVEPDATYVYRPDIVSPVEPLLSEKDAIRRTNRVYTNYEYAVDNPINTKKDKLVLNARKAARYIKDNYWDGMPSGISNCTLTASQWVDPTNPIKNASSIVNNPDKYNYSPINESLAIPGNILIAKVPGKNSYHTMLIEDFAKEDGETEFDGKKYKYKKGEPLLTYSRGGHGDSFIRTRIPLSVYDANSDGHTEHLYYRYNYPNTTLLDEIVINP